MRIVNLIHPKNTNLHIFMNPFVPLLEKHVENKNVVLNQFERLNLRSLICLGKQITQSSKENITTIMVFSTQPEFVLHLYLIRIISFLVRRKVEIYHQMHEPRYEKNRADLKTSIVLYILNWLMSKLSNMTLLPSDEAVSKAKGFIAESKIYKLNLTVIPTDIETLHQNLENLKYSWENLKFFSLIGISAQDKNPQGFLDFASISSKQYSHKAKFIRAGRDKDIILDYDKYGVIPFSGYIHDSAKDFLLSLTHFIVIPYTFSTQSGGLVEALSQGKILILNDIPAFSYLKGLSFVFVINFDNQEEIINCLDKIFSMTLKDYEDCYWKAIEYFNLNHSPDYLESMLCKLLDL